MKKGWHLRSRQERSEGTSFVESSSTLLRTALISHDWLGPVLDQTASREYQGTLKRKSEEILGEDDLPQRQQLIATRFMEDDCNAQ